MQARELAQSVVKAFISRLTRETEPLRARLAEIESRPMLVPEFTREHVPMVLEALRADMESIHARWALDWERSATQLMLKAVASIPEPKDGKDGMSLKDFHVGLMNDGRTLVLKLGDGEREVKEEVRLDIPLYRGVFKASDAYQKGDSVTYGGSLWIAEKDDPGKPGDGVGWRLAVKKGADGKDAK